MGNNRTFTLNKFFGLTVWNRAPYNSCRSEYLKMKPVTLCFVVGFALLAVISVSEAGEDDKPCECGMIYCDYKCKGGKREFEESPHAAKRALEEIKKIFADKRGPNNCRGCKCQCCGLIDCLNIGNLWDGKYKCC